MGSFGTDAEGNILGADVIVTLDQAMLRKWQRDEVLIANHLQAMVTVFPEPFARVRLPKVQMPDAVRG